MNAAEIIKWAFLAGMGYMFVRQIRKDVNGIGMGMRAEKGRSERRWKHTIATEIEVCAARGDMEGVKKFAELLRHDAYRD
jgi:hypothetical protein